ncbi:helix-turn-helix domain-containing protein [Neorhizobium sp. P12A]|uniref:helix-turn-helix transcriptional regulator n=1 Tax=Neorhizobium sp. P12A TaxID=2268027 RepID=UPI0011ED614E|nr:helix-turn-helix domain-containing protein [Neorhizobium sp. P12A]KAA0699975.1 helix-turn-helix domain-containing protein [Neorhizobium sp. P12A]
MATKLLDLAAVLAVVPVHAATLRRWRAAGRFPAPIKIGRRVLWSAAAIERWIAEEE